MKTGYTVRRIEYCNPLKVVEVRNFHNINQIDVVWWYNYADCIKDENTVGI